MPRKKVTFNVENPPEEQEEPKNKETKKDLGRYKPPDWCTKEKVREYKRDITLFKKCSNIVEAIEKSAIERELKKRDIDAFVFKAIGALYSTTVTQRFAMPATFLQFNSAADEVATNISFGNQITLKSYQDYRQKYKHLIPNECSINMLDKNPVFDWSYMGIEKAVTQMQRRVYQKKEDLADSHFMKYGFDNVEKYVQSRNDVVKFAKEMEIRNMGKFILIDDVTFEFLIHKSNYYDIMFPFLEKTGDQHNERLLKQYFENVFKTQPDTELPRLKEFCEVRNKLKPYDGWTIAIDQVDLDQQRFLHFVEKSNVNEIVNNITAAEKPGRQKQIKREELIRSAFDQWLEGELRGNFEHIRFRRLLTFDIFFTKTNFCEEIKADSNDASYIGVEIAARRYYNKYIIEDPDFVCEFQFTDGTTINDYILPRQEDRVLEFTDEMNRKWQIEEGRKQNKYEKPCPKSKKGNKPVTYVKPCPKSKKLSNAAQGTIDTQKTYVKPVPKSKKSSNAAIEIVDLTYTQETLDVETEEQAGPSNVGDSGLRIAKRAYPKRNKIVGGAAFVPGSPLSCDSIVKENINCWKERNEISPQKIIPESGSQLEEQILEFNESLDSSLVGMESMCVSQNGISEIEMEDSVFNLAPETQSMVMEQSGISDVAMEEASTTVVNLAPENLSMAMELTNLEDEIPAAPAQDVPTERNESSLPFVQIHSGGLMLINTPNTSSALLDVHCIQGSNEVMVTQMETEETSVLNVIVPPPQSFADEGIQTISSSSSTPQDIISGRIKKEHDTQYSPYDSSVQFMENDEVEPIEIDDNDNEDLFKIVKSNNNAEVEEDGGSLLDSLTPQGCSGEKSVLSSCYRGHQSGVSDQARAGTSTDINSNHPMAVSHNFIRPIAPCDRLKNWIGNLIQDSNNVIENWTDENTPTEICENTGKDLLIHPPAPQKNALSQNNSLFYSTQVTALINDPRPSSPTQVQATPTLIQATPTPNSVICCKLPWSKLVNFTFHGVNEQEVTIDKFSAKIKIPDAKQLIEIKDPDSIRLLFGLDEKTFELLVTLLRRHGKTFEFDAKQVHKPDLYQNVLLVTLFSFFETRARGQRPIKNATIRYELNGSGQIVMAEVGNYEAMTQQKLNLEEGFDPEVTKTIRDFYL